MTAGSRLKRTRLSVFIASSLDGYIATRAGSLDWLEGAASSDEDYGYETFLQGVDAIAMGRGTYDHIAHLDPMPFGGRPVFVFTHRPPPPREGVTFWQVSPSTALDHWSAIGLGRAYIDGGALISDFLAESLIDDLVLTKVPILLGEGQPLFHPIPVRTGLRLEGVQSWPSGLVNLTYSRVKPSST
jgi:dihydrofolate reductase